MKFLLKAVSIPAHFRFPMPMNDRELMRFCSDNGDARIEQEPDGEILVLPLTSTQAGCIEGELAVQLSLWSRTNGQGRVFGASMGFRLPDRSVRAAGAAWIGFDRWNKLIAKEQAGIAPVCPEFVIEVRSDFDHLPRLTLKMEAWIANGAELGWLVDPGLGMVTIYRPQELPEVHHGLNLVKGAGPVSGFEFTNGESFYELLHKKVSSPV